MESLILDKINEKFNNKYDFLKIKNVTYNCLNENCLIEVMYPCTLPLMEENEKNEIANYINEVLCLSTKASFVFKKSYLDIEFIENFVLSFLQNKYASIFSLLNKKQIEIKSNNLDVEIDFYLAKKHCDYFSLHNVKTLLFKDLNANFIANFKINIIENEKFNEIDENFLLRREQEFLNNLPKPKKVERYPVIDNCVIIGHDISPFPEFIKNQTEERNDVILAGELDNINEKTYVSKRNKSKGSSEQSYFYTFVLNDISGTINCLYFANKTTKNKFLNLKSGDKVLLIGNLKKDQRGLTYFVSNISFCEIDKTIIKIKEEKVEQEIVDNLEVEGYKTVFPKQYVCNKQADFFEKPKVYNSFVKNNKFVIFDVETTGINSAVCEITEIGAVKIEDGKIVEEFSTLVKPLREIPEEITRITGIDDEMVKDAPSINNVIFDFYKFCEGCTIVAYNISFDMGFIQRFAKENHFSFPNEQFDALALARNKLYLPRYKLINVCEALGVSLEGAHRAVNDAVATAYVFLKLNEE